MPQRRTARSEFSSMAAKEERGTCLLFRVSVHFQGRWQDVCDVFLLHACWWSVFTILDPARLTCVLVPCSILRHALDKIAEIKSLLEERRIGLCDGFISVVGFGRVLIARFFRAAAKMAGVYSDSDPPRKTMRRGVLMTLLQQSAMTLPLWIGKPGER